MNRNHLAAVNRNPFVEALAASTLAGLLLAMAALPIPLPAQSPGTSARAAAVNDRPPCFSSAIADEAVAETDTPDPAASAACDRFWESSSRPEEPTLRPAPRSQTVPAPDEPQQLLSGTPLRSAPTDHVLYALTPATPFRADAAESIDLSIARALRRTDLQENGTARAVAGVFRLASLPGTLLLAGTLYGIGEMEDRPDLSDLGIRTGQAIVGAGAVTLAGKVVAGRARPRVSPENASDFDLGRGFRGNDYQAFPSAHTAAAFATGTVLAMDIAERHDGSAIWAYPSIYAAASLAGLSRLFDEEHWASDLVAGALLGIAGGLLVNEFHGDTSASVGGMD